MKSGVKRKAAYSVPLPPIPAGMRKRGNRPLVKDVEKMLHSYGAVRMPESSKRRLKKAGMYGMPSESGGEAEVASRRESVVSWSNLLRAPCSTLPADRNVIYQFILVAAGRVMERLIRSMGPGTMAVLDLEDGSLDVRDPGKSMNAKGGRILATGLMVCLPFALL